MYDENYEVVNTEKDGTLYKKWDGKYHFVDKTKKDNSLGNPTFTWKKSEKELNLYGTLYQVFQNGSVEKKTKKTSVKKLNESAFYKLGDRKYLMVGSTIRNSDKTFATSGYLLIVIDKSGNAMLQNHELSMKTIKPIVLQTNQLTFDIASEKLYSKDQVIDLKRISGSTNEYKAPVVEEEKTEEEKTDNKTDETNNNSNINNTNNSTNNNFNINDILGNITNSTQQPSQVPLVKRVDLRSANPGVVNMDVDYSVIDLENEFVAVFLLVDDGNTPATRLQLSKDASTIRINSLSPNTEYKLTIGYIVNTGTGGQVNLSEKLVDSMNVRTRRNTARLNITKIRGNDLTFNLKFDRDYVLESGVVALYVDQTRVGEIPINTKGATLDSGWTSTFTFEMGREMLIKVENAIYNGVEVPMKVQAKMVNY